MSYLKKITLAIAVIASAVALFAQNVSVLPVASQTDFVQMHKCVYNASANHYWSASTTMNNELFAPYGEFSLYMPMTGDLKGSIVYPDTIPQKFSNVVSSQQAFDYTGTQCWAINFDNTPKKIAIFKSNTGDGNNAISWQALYFQKLFDEIFPEDTYYILSEDDLNNGEIANGTDLIVFPAVKIEGQDYGYYVNSIAESMPLFADKLQAFVKAGGNIYTEGNGVLFLEKAGLLTASTVDYTSAKQPDANSMFSVTAAGGYHPAAMAASSANDKIYSNVIPAVEGTAISESHVASEGYPIIFSIKSDLAIHANQLVANLGLTAVHSDGDNKVQILYTLNSILGFYSSMLDVTRNVENELVGGIVAGNNAIAYDAVDTFTVHVNLRNLSASDITDIKIVEKKSPYFTFGEVLTGETATIEGSILTIVGLTLGAYEEKTISYTLITPKPESGKHEDVDAYIADKTYISASKNTTSFSAMTGIGTTNKNMAYADVLFSADIFADTDVNWKNFLGLEYQPFKIFMNMENKARTQAEEVVYTQYIPKDVPFYWSDQSINVPILKTPGGKFVTVMRGSTDEANPTYDYDSDGKPDAWLDTASIYPKGYTIVEDSVYWANPWAHLKSGNKNQYEFEDIDRDGKVAKDTDGDGIVDVEEPGDKLKVYKVTWNIGTVKGYEYYEPYCYYEMWIDPPKLIELSAGAAFANDSLVESYNGMYYPNTPDIANADLTDTSWTYWMERDDAGNVIWKDFVLQSVGNYEGFTFVDTASENFRLRPTDKVMGKAPQPHREFLAVVSLGGEEIDMTHWVPEKSLYSNIDYKTIFNEEKRTPIRTTYTYYAPLPNPLQFEYLSDCYSMYDTLGNPIQELPEDGKAKLQFDIDASTEYTYYWIRLVGYDVDYNDPSEATEGVAYEAMGDGVFGYFVYEIPKGMGGYKITLPKNEDGTYNINEILQVDGKNFEKWIDNPNTLNEVEIWESAFSYQIYVPQVLIPPALDDDNFDGVDDWIDDRGDRFASKTGFLHDHFMLDNGEDWLAYPEEPFNDYLAGVVDSGWYHGADMTYGDDEFETLGKVHFTIKADYEGRGREGQVEISRGGVLVVEEIFGGSPWVIFSHALSSKAEGLDLSIESTIEPSVVNVGVDTVYLKHTIKDENEPHAFNGSFDPYHASVGYADANFTTLVGTKDPCNLIEPDITLSAIIDPAKDQSNITLIPLAASIGDPSLAEYPKSLNGTFVEIRIEATNGSDDNWKNISIKPQIANLGATELVMQYVAYPRPLVPDDDFGTFETGWRFNQPEGEVLVQLGDTIPMIQPTRRAYFVYLLKIDNALPKGIYEIPFTIAGDKVNYKGTENGALNYSIAPAQFCIAQKNDDGSVKDFEKLVISNAMLKQLNIKVHDYFQSLGEAKMSVADVNPEDYISLTDTLDVVQNGGIEIIDLSKIGSFPNKDTSAFYILQPGVVDSYNAQEIKLKLTDGQELLFATEKNADTLITSDAIEVTPIGPKVKFSHVLYSVNEKPVKEGTVYESDKPIYARTILTVNNEGADISQNTVIKINIGPYFDAVEDSLPENATVSGSILSVDFGDMIQGEEKTVELVFLLQTNIPKTVDIRQLIDQVDVDYVGTATSTEYSFNDTTDITVSLYDFEITEIMYSKINDETIHVRAKAFNRGIDAENVWFRVYPVIGQGAYEFAHIEEQIALFKAGESVIIEDDYTLPHLDKTLEMLAIIDDQNNFIETTELNNSEKTDFIDLPLSIENNTLTYVAVGPNPAHSTLNFSYTLNANYKNIHIQLFDASGQLVKTISDCPTSTGSNKVVLANVGLASGAYEFKMLADGEVVAVGNVVIE